MFSVKGQSALPFDSKTIGTNAAKHARYGVKPPAGIGILSVKLRHDAVLVCDHANFAKLGGCNPGAPVGGYIGLVSKLPDVRAVTTVHFEGAGRRTEFYDQSIDVLPHILITQARSNFLLGRRAPDQCGA